jgi:glycosyltransferase involved in cell wall biosynthesis
MNILYLCDEYPPGPHGGIGTLVQLLARQMVKMGHTVVIAGLYSSGYGGDDFFMDEGVSVYRFRWGIDGKWFEDRAALRVRITNRLLKDAGIIAWDVKRSLAGFKIKLESLINKYRIELIEMPDYNDYTRFCNSYAPFPKLSIPVIVKLNGSVTYFAKEADEQVPAHVFRIEQAILNQAAAVSSASKYTANKTAGYFFYDNKIKVLHNGIDTQISINLNDKNPGQVIFTGALMHKKGIYQLMEAWNKVIENAPYARLLILGKGDQQKGKGLLTDNARRTVRFMGHVTSAELYKYLAESAIAVFPSYSEAFALAPLEAMACRVAVINTNRTSGPELIEDMIDGLLIYPDDVEQIASAILYLLNNPEIGEIMAEKGNKKVKQHYDIRDIAQQNVEFYNNVLLKDRN